MWLDDDSKSEIDRTGRYFTWDGMKPKVKYCPVTLFADFGSGLVYMENGLKKGSGWVSEGDSRLKSTVL